MPMLGAKRPKHKGETCKGKDLSTLSIGQLQKDAKINLSYLVDFYNKLPSTEKKSFFRTDNFFNLLAGNTTLQEDIKNNILPSIIYQKWANDLAKYKEIRKKYLLYKDFE